MGFQEHVYRKIREADGWWGSPRMLKYSPGQYINQSQGVLITLAVNHQTINFQSYHVSVFEGQHYLWTRFFFIIWNPYWKIIEMINTQPWFIEFLVDWSVTPKPTIQVKSLTPPRISTEGKSWQDLDKDDDHCENSPECSAILESYLPEIKDSNWKCPTYTWSSQL